MLQEGKKAPAFSLPAHDQSKKVALKDLKGEIVVLYFYPRDNTPGCTTEAIDFTKALPKLSKLGARVLGVSKDSLESHEKFATKKEIGFSLLSDPDAKVIEKYGAWGEKNLYGKKSMGILRTTVVIDGEGVVRKVFPKVRVKGHVDAVLEAVKEVAKS